MNEQENIGIKTVTDVRKYLGDKGYSAAHSTIDRHFKKGLFGLGQDGEFDPAALDIYAAANLKRKESGKKVAAEQHELQSAKDRAKLELIEEQVKAARLRRQKEEGELIKRNNVMLELAARVGVLEAQIKSGLQKNIQDMIDTVKGKPDRAGELLSQLNLIIDDALTEYANMGSMEVVFDGD